MRYFIWNDLGSVTSFDGDEDVPEDWIPISETEYNRRLPLAAEYADKRLAEARKERVQELRDVGFSGDQIRALTGMQA